MRFHLKLILLSDNGAGYICGGLAEWLEDRDKDHAQKL